MTKAIDAANSYIDFEEAIGLEELYARTLDLIIEIATEEEGEYDDKDAVAYIERLIGYAARYAKEEGEVGIETLQQRADRTNPYLLTTKKRRASK